MKRTVGYRIPDSILRDKSSLPRSGIPRLVALVLGRDGSIRYRLSTIKSKQGAALGLSVEHFRSAGRLQCMANSRSDQNNLSGMGMTASFSPRTRRTRTAPFVIAKVGETKLSLYVIVFLDISMHRCSFRHIFNFPV